MDTSMSISNSGQVGMFTKDISKKIINRKFDLAIHSWKDLPIEPSEETEIIGTLERGDIRDVLLIKSEIVSLKEKDEIEIFTSSPRRKYNLAKILHDFIPLEFKSLKFSDVRGNIETRLKKFKSSEADMIVLAKVALDRLIEYGDRELRGYIKNILSDNNWLILPLSVFPTAPGQGAIAIEAKKNRPRLTEIIKEINCSNTFTSVTKEKKILSSYGGGCHQSIGVSIWMQNNVRFQSLKGKIDQGEPLHYLGSIDEPVKKIVNIDSKKMYPLKKDKSIFNRLQIDNKEKIGDIKNSIVYFSRKNVLDNCEVLHQSNIFWTSGVNCWKYAVKNGYWINGTSDSFGEKQNMNIKNFMPSEYDSYKISHDKASSKIYRLISAYRIIANEDHLKNLDLTDKTHFFWMSPLQFDKVIEFHPYLINKNHSCGFGKTYNHIKKILPYETKITRFFSYQHWLDFYQIGVE